MRNEAMLLWEQALEDLKTAEALIEVIKILRQRILLPTGDREGVESSLY